MISLSEFCIYSCNIANIKTKACQTGKYTIQPPLFSTNYKRPITSTVPILRNHLEWAFWLFSFCSSFRYNTKRALDFATPSTIIFTSLALCRHREAKFFSFCTLPGLYWEVWCKLLISEHWKFIWWNLDLNYYHKKIEYF